MTLIFFDIYPQVNTYDARIYAASYGNGRIQHEVSGWNFTSVSEIIDDIDVMPNNCAENIISNVFLEVTKIRFYSIRKKNNVQDLNRRCIEFDVV